MAGVAERLSGRATRDGAFRQVARWRPVARKELADHLRSTRFAVLALLTAVAAAGTVLAAAGALREGMGDDGPVPVFLRLYTVSGERVPSFVGLLTFLVPLLGVAFGFDAINGERAQRTLPRLLSQPIYRDDVIVGKLVGALAVVGISLAALVLVTGGIGILALGVAPTGADAARLLVWWAVSVVYVGVWLALAMLCSVVVRRPATSALLPLAVWLVLSLFGALLAGVVADAVAPRDDGPDGAVRNIEVQQAVSRAAPTTLYGEATGALLDPRVRTLGLVLPRQAEGALPSTLSLDQSLLLVWPHLVVLVGLVAALFAGAAAIFLRQEVRA